MFVQTRYYELSTSVENVYQILLSYLRTYLYLSIGANKVKKFIAGTYNILKISGGLSL